MTRSTSTVLFPGVPKVGSYTGNREMLALTSRGPPLCDPHLGNERRLLGIYLEDIYAQGSDFILYLSCFSYFPCGFYFIVDFQDNLVFAFSSLPTFSLSNFHNFLCNLHFSSSIFKSDFPVLLFRILGTVQLNRKL